MKFEPEDRHDGTDSRGMFDFATKMGRLSGDHPFFARAIQRLEERARSAGGSPQAWLRLANMYRQKGDIDRARQTIDLIEHIDAAGPNIRRLHAVLNQATFETISQAAGHGDGGLPNPFIIVREFLSDEFRGDLLRFAKDTHTSFAPSRTVRGEEPEIRQSVTVSAQFFPELAEQLRVLVRRNLRRHINKLAAEPIAEEEIEVQLTAYGTGDHYLPHLDCGGGDTASRKISCVIYFFHTPKRFSGGDLLLYDGHAAGAGYSTGFTRIVPRDNSAVLFRSDSWHQVAPISLASDRFEDRRFCITAWVHGL